MSQKYSHLLASVTAAKAKEVNPSETETMDPPANDKQDGKKSKKAKASDEGDEEEHEEDEDSDDGEETEKEEKRKEKKERENVDKEDKKGKRAQASMSAGEEQAARLEERLRCARIFQSKAASGRLGAACQFAFHTDLSADSAIAILETLPRQEAKSASSESARIDQRMSRVRDVNVGDDVAPSQASASVNALTEDSLRKMSPEQKALAIVNAGRILDGEAPLKSLHN